MEGNPGPGGALTGYQEVTLAGRGRDTHLPNPLLCPSDILAIRADGEGGPHRLPVTRSPHS